MESLALPLALLLALPAGAAPARPADEAAREPALAPLLREGRWRLAVGGTMCNACTRAVVEEFLAVEGVAKASFDFEEGVLRMTVAKGKPVRTARLERALRLAARRVDLGGRFTLTETRYEGPDLSAPAPAPKAAPPKPKAPETAKPALPPADFPAPTP